MINAAEDYIGTRWKVVKDSTSLNVFGGEEFTVWGYNHANNMLDIRPFTLLTKIISRKSGVLKIAIEDNIVTPVKFEVGSRWADYAEQSLAKYELVCVIGMNVKYINLQIPDQGVMNATTKNFWGCRRINDVPPKLIVFEI